MPNPASPDILINAMNWLQGTIAKSVIIVAVAVAGFWLPAGPTAATTTQTYNYDARGRLTVSCASPEGSAYRTTYGLDKADNRTNVTSQNQIITIPAATGISSADGRFYLTMQTDGNFVLYGPSGALWHTVTYGTSANVAVFQRDGNLVLYNSSGTPIWYTGTTSYCANLAVQNDGNVVIFSTTGTVVWQTNTGGH